MLMVDADGATRFSDIDKLEQILLKAQDRGYGIAVGSRAHLQESAAANVSHKDVEILIPVMVMMGWRWRWQCGVRWRWRWRWGWDGDGDDDGGGDVGDGDRNGDGDGDGDGDGEKAMLLSQYDVFSATGFVMC